MTDNSNSFLPPRERMAYDAKSRGDWSAAIDWMNRAHHAHARTATELEANGGLADLVNHEYDLSRECENIANEWAEEYLARERAADGGWYMELEYSKEHRRP